MNKILLFPLFLICLGPVFGQSSVSIIPDKDNTLYFIQSGNASNGAGDYLFFGNTAGGDPRRAVFRYDLSSFQPGDSIISAEITINTSRVANSSGRAATIHALSEDWGEGTANASGQEGGGANPEGGDATWFDRFYDTLAWTNAGGTFGPALDTITVGGIGAYTFSSSAIDAVVQAWVDGTSDNFGFIIIGDESTSSSAKRINSRENSGGANQMLITYQSPTGLGAISKTDFSIFPNPAIDGFEIMGLDGARSIELYNLNGSFIKTYNPTKSYFEVNDLAPGIYLLSIKGSNSAITKKLVVRN